MHCHLIQSIACLISVILLHQVGTLRMARRTSGNGLSTKNLLRCSTSFTLP